MLIVVISDVDDDDLSARQRAAYCAFSYQDRISDERRTPHSCACVVKVADITPSAQLQQMRLNVYKERHDTTQPDYVT